MPDQDLRTFIRDITRRHERIFEEQLRHWQTFHEQQLKQWERLHEQQLKQWERLHEGSDRLAERMKAVEEENRAQREGLFKLIDAIRDLERGLGGASA